MSLINGTTGRTNAPGSRSRSEAGIRNAARGLLLASMKRARGYFKLAKRCRGLIDQTRDKVDRNNLATLEYSYLALAKSSQVLRRSVRVQKTLERRRRK